MNTIFSIDDCEVLIKRENHYVNELNVSLRNIKITRSVLEGTFVSALSIEYNKSEDWINGRVNQVLNDLYKSSNYNHHNASSRYLLPATLARLDYLERSDYWLKRLDDLENAKINKLVSVNKELTIAKETLLKCIELNMRITKAYLNGVSNTNIAKNESLRRNSVTAVIKRVLLTLHCNSKLPEGTRSIDPSTYLVKADFWLSELDKYSIMLKKKGDLNE